MVYNLHKISFWKYIEGTPKNSIWTSWKFNQTQWHEVNELWYVISAVKICNYKKSMFHLPSLPEEHELRPLLLPKRKKKEIAFSKTSRTLLMEELKLNNNIENSFLQRIIAKISRWCLEMPKKKVYIWNSFRHFTETKP